MDKLDVLHDHYKETFLLIREREKQRDHLFFYVISLIGLLFVSSQYPSFVPRVIRVGATEWNLSALPATVITNFLWTLLLAVSLPYCSYTVLIDRQYEYLHHLESKISCLLEDSTVYQREGKLYNDDYPWVQKWRWAVYTLVFPVIVVVSVVALIGLQWITRTVGSPWPSTLLGLAEIITFVLYKAPSALALFQKKKPGENEADRG